MIISFVYIHVLLKIWKALYGVSQILVSVVRMQSWYSEILPHFLSVSQVLTFYNLLTNSESWMEKSN